MHPTPSESRPQNVHIRTSNARAIAPRIIHARSRAVLVAPSKRGSARKRAHNHIAPARSSAIRNASCIRALQPPRTPTPPARAEHPPPPAVAVVRTTRVSRLRSAAACGTPSPPPPPGTPASTAHALHACASSTGVRTRLASASHPHAPGLHGPKIARAASRPHSRASARCPSCTPASMGTTRRSIRARPVLQARRAAHHRRAHGDSSAKIKRERGQRSPSQAVYPLRARPVLHARAPRLGLPRDAHEDMSVPKTKKKSRGGAGESAGCGRGD
ncbi:hypothetical protein DFH09DRAFT_1376314 [Mycena vulgaris]|nr:hypothetical protein DFH09DRAFT_1376314 [Mycena vulgaris]